MPRLERCVVITTEDKAVETTHCNSSVVIQASSSHVTYAVRNSYNGMIIVVGDYEEREKIMGKAARSQRFMERAIQDEVQRLMY